MVSLVQLWLPILLATVLVFFASALINMLLKFWHTPDYRALANEDEVRDAIRNGAPSAGMYVLPHCTPETMKSPPMQEKFRVGPVGAIFLRPPGAMNLGSSLGQWLVFCLLVSLASAVLGSLVLAAGTPWVQVFKVFGLVVFMGHAFGSIPNAIWWAHPWRMEIKYIIDGAIYALITAGTFAWLWPH